MMKLGAISAVVPARNEEAGIAACVTSLASQPEIAQMIAVNDQSSDHTLEILRELAGKIPRLQVIDATPPPPEWVGKNHAVWTGVQQATGEWLLFTDADAVLCEGAANKALELAEKNQAAVVSFSSGQVLEKWYEKALIPFVYLRLAQKFPFEQVSDPKSPIAAANGQFLLVRSEVYRQIGGHSAVRSEVLEDVALARRIKATGERLWFGNGAEIVQARMYRSFAAMWEGWKKNLFALMGGTTGSVFAEFESAFPWMIFVVLIIGIKMPIAMFAGVVLLLLRQLSYGLALTRNQYPFKLIIYYLPAVFLYAGVLWASHESYARGKVSWKGREYPVGAPGASK